MADAITAFSMLMASQAPTFMGKPMDMVNALTKRNYTNTFLMSGRTERELFRGGAELKDRILLEANDQGEWYLPAGYETDYTNPQTGTEMSSKWRYYRFPLVWTEHEIMHDVPTGVGKRYATHQLKDVMFQKKQVVHTNAVNAMETAKWRVPVYADMEAATGKVPQSILSFICENTHSTSGIGVPLASDGSSDWGNQLQGIDVGTANTNTAFDNERLGYANATDGGASGGDLLYKLKRMRRRLAYQAMPGKAKYGDLASTPNVIAASEWGCELFSRQLRGGQDVWGAAELQDGTLLVGGIEIVYISELDTVANYAAGGSLGDEEGATNAGPRYYFLSKDCLRPIFFKDRYFHAHKPANDIRQPHAWVQNFEIWCQLWCRDRRKLGVVYPTATIS